MTTKAAPKSVAATKTAVTGASAKSCTGYNNKGKKLHIKVGMTVGMTVHMDCDDGGTLTGWRTGVVESIAVGTEHGMHGTTALVRTTFKIDSYNEGTRSVLVAARHVEAVY